MSESRDLEVEEVRRRWAAVPPWLLWLDHNGVFLAMAVDGGCNPAMEQYRLISWGMAKPDPRIENTWTAYRQASTDIALLLAEVDRLRARKDEP